MAAATNLTYLMEAILNISNFFACSCKKCDSNFYMAILDPLVTSKLFR